MDRHAEDFERQRRADPEDPEGQSRALAHRARREGPGVYLECLASPERWRATRREDADRALAQVAALLGEAYELRGLRELRVGEQTQRTARFRHRSLGFELVLIPGGRFIMGRAQGDSIHNYESPAHEVRVPPFLIGRTPITEATWDKVAVARRWSRRAGREPVVRTTRSSARRWLAALSPALRLPSEAEWEYACRAGAATRYFWGDEPDGRFCWSLENSGGRPRSVDEHRRAPNAFDLVDMLGNVFEWCDDDWIAGYDDGPFDERPRFLPEASKRPFPVRRGGAYNRAAADISCAGRIPDSATEAAHNIGFRAALSLSNPPGR